MKFIMMLIIHVTISLVYIFLFNKYDFYQRLYRGIIILFMPIWGILFFLLSDLLERINGKERLYDREELMAKRSKKEFIVKPDYQQYVNLVPLEEALILADPKEKRKLLLDVLKKSMDGYITPVKMALGDKDSETSHYAASTLMELTRRHMLFLQTMALEYEKNKEDITFSLAYAEYLRKYADSGILEEREKNKYLNQYIQVMEKIISKEEKKNISENIYGEFIEALMEVKLYDNIEKWCKEYQELYPRSEKPYLCFLKYFYLTGQNKNFFKMLQELKNSSIPVSKDTLSIIRFWMEA